MRLFLLGATGNSGRRLLRFALQRGHQVTAFVHNRNKLLNNLIVMSPFSRRRVGVALPVGLRNEGRAPRTPSPVVLACERADPTVLNP